jgi:hypothetical protein
VFVGLRRVSSGTAFGVVVALCLGTYLANYGLMSYLLARDQWPIAIDLVWPFALHLSGPNSFALRYSTLGHLTFFFLGVSAAWLFIRGQASRRPGRDRIGRLEDVLFWTATVMVVMILATPLDDVLQLPFGRYNWPIVPLLLAAMVFSAPDAPIARTILGWAPIRWFGLISYGVYIYHYPLQKVTAKLMRAQGWGVTDHWIVFGVLSLAATILVAALSYAMIERPVLRAVRARPGVRRQSKSRQVRVTGAGWAQVSLGLRSEQITYLERLSTERGKSLSGAMRYVISEFIRRLEQSDTAEEGHRNVRAAPAGPRAGPPDAKRRDSAEEGLQAQVVNLRANHVEFLGELSARLGTSMSHTVEMIIDDFSRESAAREN